MSDYGNTAAFSPVPQQPVEPSTKNIVQETFDKMISGLVNASELARVVKHDLTQKVEELDQKVKEITAQLEDFRKRNAELDALLHDVRRQRDEAEDKVRSQASEINSLRDKVEGYARQVSAQEQEALKSREELTHVKHDRDEAHFKVMELEAALTKANERVASVYKALGIEQPKPEVDVLKATQSQPEPVEAPTQSPPPVQQAGEVSSVDWNKPHRWNPEKGTWENYSLDQDRSGQF